ncbi:MAG: hypothetical protein NZM04_02860 [Methylacidiphilales bacterium]|nr:hypothetical protein [Candidatus Methylacidiphilales bacterium]MDW8348673.1 hypothetical protein [Verrucomicrobiae bacterium]
MKKTISIFLWAIVVAFVLSFFLPWMKFDFEEVMPAYERQAFRKRINEEEQRGWVERWIGIREEEKEKAFENPFLGYNALSLINLLRDKPIGSELRLAILRPHFPFKEDEDKALFILSLPIVGIFAVLIQFIISAKKILLPFPFFACLVQYTVVRWHLNEHYADRVINDVHIGIGLWITLYALLAVCMILFFKITKEVFKTGGE